MHSVARDWHVDVARFLFHHGAYIDVPDNYGRTPLFVAVAGNHTEMIVWLIENGGKRCILIVVSSLSVSRRLLYYSLKAVC